MRSGPANGSTHTANMKNRNIHPDRANQMKNIVVKLLPKGEFKKSLSCFLYLGQFRLKSRVKVRHRCVTSKSRSSSLARPVADSTTAASRLETEYRRSMRSAVFLVSNRSCSNPLLALRHASLQSSPDFTRWAKPSKSLRVKARIVAVDLWVRRRWWGRCSSRCEFEEKSRGGWCHGRFVATTTTQYLIEDLCLVGVES